MNASEIEESINSIISGFDRDQRSMMLYAESCCVDHGGLLIGIRMNAEDHEAAAGFVTAGYMRYWPHPCGTPQLPFSEGPERRHALC